MGSKSKAIGREAERAVALYLIDNGWPYAERRALAGAKDKGDITGTPGLVFEVKAGERAYNASDALIDEWLEETRRECENASADYGVLVVRRKGHGIANAGRWWAYMRLVDLLDLHGGSYAMPDLDIALRPVRMHLYDACRVLRAAGYGGDERDARESGREPDRSKDTTAA